MSALPHLTREMAASVDWRDMVDALEIGHRTPDPAQMGDLFLSREEDTLMARAAWIGGMGAGVKSFTVMPGNPARGRPSVQGAMLVFDPETGSPRAVIDNDLLGWFKTAADSVLGARLLARPDARRLTIIGAGNVAASLIEAYRAVLGIRDITVVNRTAARAEALAREMGVAWSDDIEGAVRGADIVSTCTLSAAPVVPGAWLAAGQHLDLIGAFKAHMRETDDDAMRRARVFVDARESTLEHIGELRIPLAEGVITPEDIAGDLRALVTGSAGRRTAEEITLYKNGGGAHLDLMIACRLLEIAGVA